MREKSMFKAVGLFLLILTAAQVAFADAGADLKQAEGFYKAGQYAKAEQIYQDVLNKADPNKPDELELAFNARRKLPCVYLVMDRQPQAQAGVEQLLAKHPGHERLPHAIHEIVEQAKKLEKMPRIRQVYQDILAAQPGHPQEVWLKMGIAIANAHLNNDEAVSSTLQNIIAQDAGDDRAAEALGQTAWAYRKLNQQDKARKVYQYVVDNWPKKDRAIFSQRGIVLCSIAMGDQAGAEAGLQKLLADYADSKYMAEIVRNIAGEYYRKGKVAEASGLHQYVADKYPKSIEALWCQRDVALCCIDAGNEQAVQAALQKLATGFAGHAQLPEALADTGEYYRKKGNLKNARQVHQYVVEHFPTSAEAIQSQRNAILCSVGLNDEPQIKTGIETLLTQFAQNKDIATVVDYVADRLGDSRDDQKLKLYQYIVDQHPQHEVVVPAKARVGQIMLRRGDDKGAEAVFQKILADYKGHPLLAQAVHYMADGYLDRSIAMEQDTAKQMGSAKYAQLVREQGRSEVVKDYCRKAIEKWRITIEELPPTPRYTEQAWYFTGVVYRRHLGEAQNALPYYEKVVQTWPDYEYAWSAQAMIGLCYRTLVGSAQISEQEAAPKIEQAYKAVIEKYTDCSLAPEAYINLGMFNLLRGRWDEGAKYLQQYVERYPETKPWPLTVIHLGIAYEKKGQPDVAAELYRTFLGATGPDDPRVENVRARFEQQKEVER